ncbi:MAG: PQQ-binding-like beta-propeller repeat protein [Pirellulales bacterium]|nr:PQQ-binding-like beta-propeller repeat protein [Pirellulales bacterium]
MSLACLHRGGWCAVPVVLLLAAASAKAADNCPEFLLARDGDGAGAGALPDHWSATENIAWKTDLPGLGWSSPVVWNGRVFVTTAIPAGQEREPKRGLYLDDVDASKYGPPTLTYQYKVYCLDLATGQVLWDRVAYEGVPPKPHHMKNSLASETMAVDPQRVYAYFGNVGIYCYDHDGQPLWERKIEPTETRYSWGTGASPIVHLGRVYLVNDNEDDSYALALDGETGQQIWRVEREEGSNWATPFIWENELRTELVTPGTDRTRSYDLDGNLLWDFHGMAIISIPRPFTAYGLLYVTSGHVLTPDRPFYAIRPGAKGDISLAKDETSNEHIVWCRKEVGPYHPTPILYRDVMYILYDQGFFASLDPKTGETILKKTRIPNGRAFTSSPWAYDGKIFCLNEDGVTFVINADPKFEILHTNSLAEDDMCLASPCVVESRLLIRTAARLYCVQKPGS